ncbi:hypothetical protein [Piscinibacter sp.]|uniref:hypothetical protein n=1 Tax=Piscinibacter sp. TaxID=1903157 RepID=UPI002C3328A4|nr:hypothetical protein [Albitalea sp.]HUG25895.1 hypothetical protein [Albitalea sp.]
MATASSSRAAKTAAKKQPAKKAPAVKRAPAARKKTPAAPAVAAQPKAPQAPTKTAKPKLVRDSFTIPKAEYTVLDALKRRSGQLAHQAKKSELLRAGIKALAAMGDAAFLEALKAVPAIKTGRPKAKKATASNEI